MRRREDSDELFELAGRDPQSWLHQARLLKASAQLPLNELSRLAGDRSGMTPYERSEALMTYMQSFMLLTSFAFENLIKAILIGRAPAMVSNNKLSPELWQGKDGHKLTEIIPKDITLSDQERNLLARLQTFAVWGGRYPIPIRSHDYHWSEGLLSFRASDPALIDQLFLRLVGMVIDE